MHHQVLVRKRLIQYNEKHGMGNNVITNKNILKDLERRIQAEELKINKRKTYRLKELEDIRGGPRGR